jgi:uncharacterized membrane protein
VVKIETSVKINRPVEVVFSFVSNVENDCKWSLGTLENKFTSDGPIGEGSSFKEITMFLGRRIESIGEYIEFIPNKKIVCKVKSGPIPAEGIFNFEDSNDGTKITMTMEIEIGKFFKLAKPLIVRMFKRQLEAEYQNLKDLLESQVNPEQ